MQYTGNHKGNHKLLINALITASPCTLTSQQPHDEVNFNRRYSYESE